jgi:uncharacterized protein
VDLQQKYNSLKQSLTRLGKVAIAFSGGVDSSLLLKVAVDTLTPKNVLACYATSPSQPEFQRKTAIDFADSLNVKLIQIPTNEISDPDYVANRPDRCYVCKIHILAAIKKTAYDQGFENILCGNNVDDEKDFRPGNLAVKEQSAICPLLDANMTKQDIRQLSRQLNLSTAETPSSPCLASRVAYGIEITAECLKQVEDAESYLRQLGFVEFRVRHHGDIARIEVLPAQMDKAFSQRKQISKKLKSIGFKFVTLDMRGLRSGSLNEALSSEDKKHFI